MNDKIKTRKAATEQVVEVKNSDGSIDMKKYGKRTPLHKQKKVGIKAREGWTRRLVNDRPGRIESFFEAGWTLVDGEQQIDNDGRLQDNNGLGTKFAPVVNTKPGAMNTRAVWMEIPTVLFEDDQKEKERLLDIQEEQIKPRSTSADSSVFSGANIK